jgi:hypothetical protein
MRRTAALAVLLAFSAPLSALAQTHSQEDEAACTPDVLRLCQQYIPKRPEIIACLVANKSDLSPACHEVFSRPPQKAQESRRPPRKPLSPTGGNLN